MGLCKHPLKERLAEVETGNVRRWWCPTCDAIWYDPDNKPPQRAPLREDRVPQRLDEKKPRGG